MNLFGYREINKTHFPVYKSLNAAREDLKAKIHSRGNLPHVTIREQYLILDALSDFPLGQHILLTGGANGVWTDYIISPQEYLKQNNGCCLPSSIIENFLLFYSPVVKAQRELFQLLQSIAQSHLKNGTVFASIPCGMMRDLLTLDFSFARDATLVGIDIDPISIENAQQLASKLGVSNVFFLERDAWDLGCPSEFDFISSIGLNVYESDEENVIELYRQFYKSLKPCGVLFTGILTWPSYIDEYNSDWEIKKIPKYDLYLEHVIHKDILDIKWLNFRKLSEIERDFRRAGFSKITVHKDACSVFPAVIAQK